MAFSKVHMSHITFTAKDCEKGGKGTFSNGDGTWSRKPGCGYTDAEIAARTSKRVEQRLKSAAVPDWLDLPPSGK
jgi:hypothetical protein